MERRFRVRLAELLDDAEVPPGLLRGVLPRLEAFLEPFTAALHIPEQQTNAQHYVQGLVSDLKSKDVESIAYLHDRERQGLQKFIGQADWDHQPLLTELVRQVGTELGEPDGILVFDPSAFPKKGTESVGVQRQWCGRLGKIDNCQVGLYLGYVCRQEHALVDVRLYLPREWSRRKRRRQKAGVPEAIRFRTRHELFLEMLDERGQALPTPGAPGTTNWAGLRGFASNCGRGARPTCWPCRRTPRSGIWSRRTRRTAAVAAGRWSPSRGWIAGAPPCRRRRGRRSRSATANRDRSWCRSRRRWCRRGPRAGWRTWWSGWGPSANGQATAVGSTTTCCRMPWSGQP